VPDSVGLAVVVLAAGRSLRLGECKALVDLGGRTPLDRLLDASSGLGDAPALVVTGAHHERIVRALEQRRSPFEVALNADWASGRTGSVRVAWKRRRGFDLLLAPVDVPMVPREVFEALAGAWSAAGAPPRGWLAPRHGARGGFGHPIVVGRELAAGVETLAPDTPLRELRDLAEPRWAVEVASPEVLDDLDDPGDLERLRRRL
jgi:molybdenum cofactor cytidylyltransferase